MTDPVQPDSLKSQYIRFIQYYLTDPHLYNITFYQTLCFTKLSAILIRHHPNIPSPECHVSTISTKLNPTARCCQFMWTKKRLTIYPSNSVVVINNSGIEEPFEHFDSQSISNLLSAK